MKLLSPTLGQQHEGGGIGTTRNGNGEARCRTKGAEPRHVRRKMAREIARRRAVKKGVQWQWARWRRLRT